MPQGEYLLEVRSEEIPARMLEPGVRELATRVFEELMARGLGPREVETGYSPRRLVLILNGLPEREPDREEQVLGPPVSAAFAPDGSPKPAAAEIYSPAVAQFHRPQFGHIQRRRLSQHP